MKFPFFFKCTAFALQEYLFYEQKPPGIKRIRINSKSNIIKTFNKLSVSGNEIA